MTKKEFVDILNKQLKYLPLKERQKTLTYYEEIFEDYEEEGLSEEEVALKLGSPIVIANEILDETHISGRKPMSVLMIILLVLGFPLWGSLVATAAILLLTVYILIWIPVVILGSFSIAFLAAGVVGIIGVPFVMMEGLGIGVVQLGMAILCVGLCIPSTIACINVTKHLVKATRFITQKWMKIFKKQEVL